MKLKPALGSARQVIGANAVAIIDRGEDIAKSATPVRRPRSRSFPQPFERKSRDLGWGRQGERRSVIVLTRSDLFWSVQFSRCAADTRMIVRLSSANVSFSRKIDSIFLNFIGLYLRKDNGHRSEECNNKRCDGGRVTGVRGRRGRATKRFIESKLQRGLTPEIHDVSRILAGPAT